MQKLSRFGNYCLIMNGVVGAGVLVIPKVFQTAGILASLLVLVFVAGLCWMMQIELLAITEKLTEEVEQKGELKEPLMGMDSESHDHFCVFFLLFCFSITANLTAYTNIAATAFGTVFTHCDYTASPPTPDCEWNYRLFAMISTIVIAVLTAIDYKEQESFQVLMAVIQATLAGLIVGYCVVRGGGSDLSWENGVVSDYSSVKVAFATMFFAMSYHLAAPSILAAAQKDHRIQLWIAMAVSLSTLGVYCVVGVVGAVMVPNLPDNVSLLFKNETFGYPPDSIPLPLVALIYIILILPVNDIATNSPMYGKALSGAITSLLYGVDHAFVRQTRPITFRLIRILSVLPSLLVVIWSTQLVTSTQGSFTDIGGSVGAVLVMVYVPVCYNRARKRGKGRSGYEFHGKWVKWTNRGIACGFLVFLVSLVARVFV